MSEGAGSPAGLVKQQEHERHLRTVAAPHTWQYKQTSSLSTIPLIISTGPGYYSSRFWSPPKEGALTEVAQFPDRNRMQIIIYLQSKSRHIIVKYCSNLAQTKTFHKNYSKTRTRNQFSEICLAIHIMRVKHHHQDSDFKHQCTSHCCDDMVSGNNKADKTMVIARVLAVAAPLGTVENIMLLLVSCLSHLSLCWQIVPSFYESPGFRNFLAKHEVF